MESTGNSNRHATRNAAVFLLAAYRMQLFRLQSSDCLKIFSIQAKKRFSRHKLTEFKSVHLPKLRPSEQALILLALVVLAYLPALQAGYIWDDPYHVTKNPLLLTLRGLWRIWFEVGAHRQYYPLTLSVFWAEYQLWGLAPFGYHLLNVLLHGINALLVWRLCRKLGLPAAWLAGAVFALRLCQRVPATDRMADLARQCVELSTKAQQKNRPAQ